MGENYNKLLKLNSYIDRIENSADIHEIADKTIKLIKEDLKYSNCFFLQPNNNKIDLINASKGPYYEIATSLSKKLTRNANVDFINGQSILEKSIRDKKIYISNDFNNLFPIKLPRIVENLIRRNLKEKCAVFVPCISDKTEALLLLESKAMPTRQEQVMLEILGKQIGYGIKNSQLLKRISQDKENLSNILDHAEYAICIYKDWQIHYINPKFSELTGYSQEEMRTINDFRQLIPDSEKLKVERISSNRKESKSAPKYYYSQILTKTGKTIDGEVRIIPIIYKEQKMFSVQFKDIGIRNRMKKIMEDQSEYFAEIAHSLKTPFTVINGLIELQLSKPANPEVTDLLNTIRDEIEGASAKVSKLLRVAKSNLTIREIKLAKYDFQKVIESAYVKGKSLGYRYCTPTHSNDCNCLVLKEKVNAIIDGDPEALTDVLITIIENAYIHSPRENEQARIELSTKKTKDSVVIYVKDYGKGMPQKFASKVFDAQNMFSINVRGHGIGLPSARKLVEQMGGEIQLKTHLHKGTTFIVTLPLKSTTS